MGAHETTVRVRYGEVDRMGFVYHAHYLVYFEQGRTEALRSLGSTYRALEDDGTLLVVVETGVRHLRPATYDDEIVVHTELTQVKGVRMRFEYEVLREGKRLATGFTVLAACDKDGRPRRLPPEVRAIMQGAAQGGGPENGKPEGTREVQEAESRREEPCRDR